MRFGRPSRRTPDLNVGDADAEGRSIQIARINAILGDPELRADRPTTKLAATRDFAAGVMGLVFLTVVLVGAYTLFTRMSELSGANKMAASTTREAADAAPSQPSPPIELNNGSGLGDKSDNPETSGPTAVAPTANNDAAVKDATPAPTAVLATDAAPAPTAVAPTANKDVAVADAAPAPTAVAPTANNDVAVKGAAPVPSAVMATDAAPAPTAVAPTANNDVAVKDAVPAPSGTAEQSPALIERVVTIATGNTFQQVIASSATERRALTVQNNNTNGDKCWVHVGSDRASQENSNVLTVGNSYVRNWPFSPSDAIQATCASSADTVRVEYR